MSERRLTRNALVAIVRENVAWLLENDRRTAIEVVMELTGFRNNMSQQTIKGYADAIVALAAVIPMDWLEDLAHVAVFERHFGRRNGRYIREVGDFARATEAADRAVRRRQEAA
jgi:hypothetical protein